MPANLAEMLRKTQEMIDLSEIPGMSPGARDQLLTEYRMREAELATQEESALMALRLVQRDPGYRAIKSVSLILRTHRNALRSLERIEQAIAHAELKEKEHPTWLAQH